LNILIYIPHLSQKNGGIRQYAVTLLKMLHEIKGNQYFIYHDVNDPEVIQAIADKSEFSIVTTNDIETQEVVYKKVPIYRFNGIPVLGKLKFKRKFVITNNLESYCERQNIQIIHCPYQYIPKVEGVKLISTLHDVQEIHFPEFFTAEGRASRANNYLDYLRRSDSVIVSYKHIKEDLIKYFNVPEKNIKTILLQMGKLWFDKFSDKDITPLPFNLESKKYLLYPANAWKHKNHLRLIEALVRLRDKENIHINLVFTGDFSGEYGKCIVEKTNQLGLEKQVTFLGIVEENVLFSLYKKAFGVVIPTLYEAGSFPLMESILLDVPVICSKVTSLPETIGNQKFIFDPFDIDDVVRKILCIWNDENYRADNLTQIKLQANKIKENDSLPILQKLYAELSA
jgi:glycosyltransferase involved in cell wall biosynthesis